MVGVKSLHRLVVSTEDNPAELDRWRYIAAAPANQPWALNSRRQVKGYVHMERSEKALLLGFGLKPPKGVFVSPLLSSLQLLKDKVSDAIAESRDRFEEAADCRCINRIPQGSEG
jgi:hypothetical protein